MTVNVALSWDLFLVVFFAIVMSYSFIIGKTQSVRVIIAVYIAIIATQGIGNFIERLGGMSLDMMRVADVTFNFTALSLIKIVVFAFFIIVFSLRSGIHVTYGKESNSLLSILYTALFGFTTAALIVSTILTYVGGKAILDTTLGASAALAPIAAASPLMQVIILNQDLWFALPAILIVAAGFIHNE